MSIKDIQVSLYDVLSAFADAYLGSFMPYCYHDCTDSARTVHAARDMMESVSKALGHPTTMVNFIKAYKKPEYIQAVKEYLDDCGEDFNPKDFATPLPINLTKKDLGL